MKFKRKQVMPENLELKKAENNSDISHWSDFRSVVTGFPSTPKPRPPTSIIGTQTDKIITKYQEICTTSKHDVQIQTVAVVEAEPVRASTSQAYPPSLYAFFAKVTDPMCIELRKRPGHGGTKFGVQSKSGNNFKFDELKTKSATILHRLKSSTLPENFQAKSVSWHPSGTQLAVGHHSASIHIEWCRHQRIPVTIWSLAQKILKKGPLHEIPFDSCASLVKFHPSLGNLLAVGFYSGEVALLDFNGKDKEPQLEDISKFLRKDKNSYPSKRDTETGAAARESTKKSHYEFKHRETFVCVDGSCHAQEITSLLWIHCTQSEAQILARKNPSPFHHFLVTSSVDGFIGLWSIDKYTSRLFLERCYVIHASNIPDSFKQGNLYQFSLLKQLGIDALDCFSKDEPTQFICSTTGSFLFTGNLMSDTEIDAGLTTAQGNTKIYSPEPKFLFREEEYVSQIHCSPYHSHLYAYVTMFGRMAIRNMKNEYEANLELYMENDKPASQFKWSNRPMMFGIILEKALLFFDLTIHKSTDVLRIDNDASFCTVEFNMDDTKYVAGTDKSGRLNIWKLPSELAVSDVTEMLQFSSFADFQSKTNVEEVVADSEDELDSDASGDEAAEKSSKSTLASNPESSDRSAIKSKDGKPELNGVNSDLKSKSKFYQDPSPLGDAKQWQTGYSGVHSDDTVEQILKLGHEDGSQNLMPIILPNILSSWSPTLILDSTSSVQNPSDSQTGSSQFESRERSLTNGSDMLKQNDHKESKNGDFDPPVDAAHARLLKSRSKNDFSDNLGGRSVGNELALSSTLAEVQVHSPNDLDSVNHEEGGLEELLSDEIAQKGTSSDADAESLEIDSNPNSSSNAEDTVIETKSQV